MKIIFDIIVGGLCTLTVFSPIIVGIIGLIVTNDKNKGGNK